MNTYAYVSGNPVMFVDPLGLQVFSPETRDNARMSACLALGGAGAYIGGGVAGGACVTSGGAAVVSPGCAAGGAVVGGALGCGTGILAAEATIGTIEGIAYCAEGINHAWNWVFSESAEDNSNTLPEFDFHDPSKPPIGENGEEWEWRGPDAPGGERGAWVNPNNPNESLHPDLDHPTDKGIPPHWDYTDRGKEIKDRIDSKGNSKPK